MPWWHAHNDARVLFTVQVPEAHSGNGSLMYREATRRVERGMPAHTYAFLGSRVDVFASADDGFIPSAPVAAWQERRIPPDLYRQWAESDDLRMYQAAAVTFGSGVVRVMAPDVASLVTPGVRGAGLSSKWAPLFPGRAVAEAIVQRDPLRSMIALMQTDPERALLDTSTMVRERVAFVTCPTELALW